VQHPHRRGTPPVLPDEPARPAGLPGQLGNGTARRTGPSAPEQGIALDALNAHKSIPPGLERARIRGHHPGPPQPQWGYAPRHELVQHRHAEMLTGGPEARPGPTTPRPAPRTPRPRTPVPRGPHPRGPSPEARTRGPYRGRPSPEARPPRPVPEARTPDRTVTPRRPSPRTRTGPPCTESVPHPPPARPRRTSPPCNAGSGSATAPSAAPPSAGPPAGPPPCP
jgi:hypothetical protein